MATTAINFKERRDALMARRELRNPGLMGTQIKNPAARNWRNLLNNTTKFDAIKSVVKMFSK